MPTRAIPTAAKSGPGLRRCSPERAADHDRATQWFRSWCQRNNISVRDLAAILDVAIAVAEKKLNGKSPLNTTDIKRFPPRFRNDLLLAYGAYCASSDLLALHA